MTQECQATSACLSLQSWSIGQVHRQSVELVLQTSDRY